MLEALFLVSLLPLQSAELAPPPTEAKPIIVQGQRDRERQVRNFIRDLTPAPQRGQLGRFETAICPAVAGLTAAQEAFIAHRIRRVAQAADMPVAKARCDPNVILIVTSDKRALIKQLEKKRRDYFPSVRNHYDFDALEDPRNPVAAWQIEWTRGADGKDLQQDMAGSSVGRTGFYVQRTSESSTRIKPAARQYFAAAVVVVQADALLGLTPTQLADYAAMRAFVRTDPAKLNLPTESTILRAVPAPIGVPIPLTMTAWDLSFLKSYYASRLNSYAASQRSEMRDTMIHDLQTEEPPAKK